MSYRFTWDENKAASNIITHQGVSFDERPQEIIHIISARLPTKKERKAYEENVDF